MDVQKKLDEIVDTVGRARSMPMSASCVVNRAELLAMLEEVRAALPGSLAQAQELIGGRDQMVEEAQREAVRIIESARAERESLISGTEIARRSQEEADRILAEARREAEEIRAEADDYVDSKLANFEVVLTKTLGSVDRGREKLLGRGPGLDEQGYLDEDAPERSADPETLRQRADAYVDAKLSAFEAVLSKTLEAVGRGRQKLHGRQATDELGALAAQDGAAHAPQTSDAEYLAGLADPQQHVPQQPVVPQQQPEVPAQQDYYAPGPQPAHLQTASYQQDAYAYQGHPQQQAYGYQQDAYGYPMGYDPNAGYAPQQSHQPHPQEPAAALDETSLFDTSMIDLDQLRQYEQGR